MPSHSERVEQALDLVENRKFDRSPSELEKILAVEVRRLQAELGKVNGSSISRFAVEGEGNCG